MAILTIPTITKGSPSTITLNKAELFALAIVAADPYFAVQANVKSVIAEFESDPSSQKKILTFDLSKASPSAEILLSIHAKDPFLLTRLILVDHDAGQLVVERAHLPSGLDVSVAPPAP